MALHYVKDYEQLVQHIANWLTKGGNFVFSVEHPVFTSYGNQDWYYDENGNILVNEVTGQSVQKNILCQPEKDSELYNIYESHADQMETPVNELPTCEEFTLTSNKYDGLWEAILVRPLAFIILQVGFLFNNFGISVMVVGLLIRLVLMPL